MGDSFVQTLSEHDRTALSYALLPALREHRANGEGYVSIRSPLREDTRPSFSFSPTLGRGHDFGTDESYDLVSLAEAMWGCTPAEAIRRHRETLGRPGAGWAPPTHPTPVSGDGQRGRLPDAPTPAAPTPAVGAVPVFWTPERKQGWPRAVSALAAAPDAPMVRAARLHDGLSHATLCTFGCGLVPKGKSGSALVLPYPTGAQAYLRVPKSGRAGETDKRIWHDDLGVKMPPSVPTASFFGEAQLTGAPILLIAKSPREAMLIWQIAHKARRVDIDVLGLPGGERRALGPHQRATLLHHLRGGVRRLVAVLDADTDAARAVASGFTRHLQEMCEDRPGVEVAVVDVTRQTGGTCKDLADAVRAGIDPVAWLDGETCPALTPVAPSPAPDAAATRRKRYFVVENPCDVQPVPRQFVIDRFASLGDITVIGGAPGSGKSLLVQYLLQRRHAQSLLATRPAGITLYVTGFDASKAEIVRRAHLIGGDGLRMLDLGNDPEYVPLLRNDVFADDLADCVMEYGADSLVLDTVADFHGDEMNDAMKANRTMSALRRLAERANVAIIVITHTRKGNGPKMRLEVSDIADSRIFASKADYCFGLVSEMSSEGTSLVELQLLKTRTIPLPAQRFTISTTDDRIEMVPTNTLFSLEMEQVERTDKRMGDIESARQMRRDGKSVREIADLLGVSKSTAATLAKKAPAPAGEAATEDAF